MKPTDHPKYRQYWRGVKVDNTDIDMLTPDMIDIGENFSSAEGSWILSHDSRLCPVSGKIVVKKTKVGNNVFLGLNSIVMPGVTVGDNVIVGAGAVVTKDIPSGEIWAGNPAKCVSKTEDYLKKAKDEDGKSLVFVDKVKEVTSEELARFRNDYESKLLDQHNLQLLELQKETDDKYKFESDYWGNCTNTLNEELKQFLYAEGLNLTRTDAYGFRVGGKKILDIGGGPVSLLLKCKDHGKSKVVDPIGYPQWTIDRYASNNINYEKKRGEDITETGFDEVWIYNCLQHVDDPIKIIENAKKAAPILRIFEWLDIPVHDGHPHELKEEKLNEWIGQKGNVSWVKVEKLPHLGHEYFTFTGPKQYGKCYFGTFEHKN